MPWIQTDHGKLYYETSGEGKSLALLHGMWSSHAVWRGMVPELSRTHHVVILDHMGHGKSDHMRIPYSLTTYASDLKQLIDHLGIETLSLAGFSLGSLVAQEYYRLFPSQVTSLVLIATPPPYKFRWKFGIWSVSLLERLRITSLKKESIKALSRRYSRGTNREFIEKSLNDLSLYDDHEFALILRSVWHRTRTEMTTGSFVPSLIAVGEKDAIRSHSHALHRAIPDSRLLIVPGSDHSVILNCPELLATEISHFLAPREK
jgi:pimeloyl-ACP methyl ester carboxylesterase